MRTTLKIDDDVYEDARVIASRQGRSLGTVISDLARRSLRPAGITYNDGFPVFNVEPGAPSITSEDVARVLDEE